MKTDDRFLHWADERVEMLGNFVEFLIRLALFPIVLPVNWAVNLFDRLRQKPTE